jgi:hypothetical protein
VGGVAAADAPVATVTQTLAGLNDVAAGGYEPPDVQVAAGAGYVVEMVNLAERIWRTDATSQPIVTRTLASFFGSADDRLTDPRIAFDAASGRWFASISNVERNSVMLAVSATSDPTGAWSVTSYQSGGCADQPRIGISDSLVVLAADIFDGCEESGSALVGNELWVVNKQQLLAGSTTPAFTTYGPTAAYSSVSPVLSLSPTGTEYAVSVDDRASRVVHVLAIDGVPPAAVSVQEVATPAIAPLLRPPQAAQPPGPGLRPAIATNDNRVLDSIWENGRLWLSANGRCIPPGDVLVRSCARIVQLDTGAGTVVADTDISRAGAHVFYPAISPDRSGNLVIAAGESSTTFLPQLVVMGRTADGTVTAATVVQQSAGPYRGDRYGDYFGAARDPANPDVVWVAGEAGTDAPGGVGWATAVASVVVTAAGAQPPAVAGAPPPGVRAVGRVVRVGDKVRLVYRALDDGDKVRAVVTFSRGASTVYQVSTRRQTLRADQQYSVLWAAKKQRGPFTYCVTAVSLTGLSSPPSCVPITVR